MGLAREESVPGPGPTGSLSDTQAKLVNAKKLCMLLPRCNLAHRRLRCVLLLRDLHAKRVSFWSPFQIDPITAKAKAGSNQPKSKGAKNRKFREGKRKERKARREGRFPFFPAGFSSRLRLHNKNAQCPRRIEGADAPSSRTFPGHLGASENDGGLSCSFYLVSLHLLFSTVSF